MTQDNSQDNVQPSQENQAQTQQETPSDPNVVRDMMKYKTQRNELRDEIANHKAKDEERRQKKLTEEGKHKELISELTAKNEKLQSKVDVQGDAIKTVKLDLINSITSDESEREELVGESLKTLRFLKSKIKQTVPNPTATLGEVRNPKTEFNGHGSLREFAANDPKGCDEYLRGNVEGYQWGQVKK